MSTVILNSEPVDGCQELSGPVDQWTGKAVLIRRGGCNFVVKMHFAELAGAALVIVYNNVPNQAPLTMVMCSLLTPILKGVCAVGPRPSTE